MSITWETPPTAHVSVRPSKHAEFIAQLKARPGKWAVLSEDSANSTAAAISRGKITAFAPAGTFEATSRSNGTPGRVKVWVRYVGRKGQASRPDLAAIRVWAVANNWVIARRGRVPADIITAYDTAHQDES